MKMPEMGLPQGSKESKFRRKIFKRLTPGNHIIRIMPGDQGFYITYTHWINGVNIECPGEDCPICANNRKLITEFPETFRDVAGYSYRRKMFFVNILDLTEVKVCPECQTENFKYNGSFPTTCTKRGCSVFINDVVPTISNKIKILSRGKQLYEEIRGKNDAILDANGEVIGIDNYDLMLLVSPETKEPTTQALTHLNEKREAPEELYNLKEAPLKLSSEEISDFLRGVQLRDIFKSRGNVVDKVTEEAKTNGEVAEKESIESLDAVREKAEEGLRKLFA